MASPSGCRYLVSLSLLVSVAFDVSGASATAERTRPAAYIRYHPQGHVVDIDIGTPPRRVVLIFDTGSNLLWVKSGAEQPFNSKSSSSIVDLPCSHNLCQPIGKMTVGCDKTCTFDQTYGDSSGLHGFMATETFTIWNSSVNNLIFGYATSVDNELFPDVDGIMGFASGNLSLLNQLGISKFSYCLTNSSRQTSTPLLLGEQAVMKPDLMKMALSLPIIKSPGDPAHHYVALEAISVSNRRVPLSFQVKAKGMGGVMLDSGSESILLEKDTYLKVMDAFADELAVLSPVDRQWHGSDTAGFFMWGPLFNKPVPKLKLHVKGGIDFQVPTHNYVEIHNAGEGEWYKYIKILRSPIDGLNLFGNFFQQNMQILYDLEKETVSLAPTDCSKF